MIKRTLLFAKPAKLSIRNRQLWIERKEEAPRSVPVADIGMLIIEHQQISLSHAVIQACMEANVIIVNCDDRHMPQGIMHPLEGHVELSERYQAQLSASVPLKKNLWAQTVQAKITNQTGVLRWRGQPSLKMDHLVREVTSGDGTNCEGQAAAIYWSSIFFSYPLFIRERFGEPPNHYLNYGYAVIRAMMARALVSSGLLLALGIHHHNKYNAFCLVDDIMEPYRPYVDALVCALADESRIGDELLTAEKMAFWSLASQDVQIDSVTSPMWNAMQRTAQSLVKCFDGSARKLLYPQYEAV
ncbi:MAG TPA: type II CRISPR-associated endonuclease Cas1 [Saprospiraceae bacterium]|nr:type II CRISPR-associated endonuclease Cas1 [Saprospiraceae bacterium]